MKALYAVSSQAAGAGFAASPFRMCFVNCYRSTSLSRFLSYKSRLGLKVSFLNWEKPRRRRPIPVFLVTNYWKCWVCCHCWLVFNSFWPHGLQHTRYCCSVAHSFLTLCDPMDCSTPGFSVLHRLPEFAQTHVHWVSYATQPSRPLSPSSPSAPSVSQHQGLF